TRTIPRSRVLFIKQDRVCRETVSLFVVRCREREPFVVKFGLEDYRQLREIDFAQVAAGNTSSGGRVTTEPLYLVCTHGRRDKCCAKFGFPLFKSLRAEDGDSVWQSSHVGGDRFAANLVCFPHGLFYAHTTADSAKVIMKEYRERRIFTQNYRGRACYSHHVQAAEFFVRTESRISRIDDLHRLESARTSKESWQVRFLEKARERIHVVRVSRVMSDFQNLITCHSGEAQQVPQFRLDDYNQTQQL
ncbi:MAG: sucrase ferredoxin, partial [Acidobacteriota bacterium]|nr:sucrase ferredoxin [Acidobacteriota bacterium]